MSIQNQKNVQKNRKILKNLLMYDKKNSFSHTEQQEQPKKNTLPQQKKLERKKNAEIPEKKLKGNSPEKKNKP
jgi:hypothetical protein